MARKPVGRTDGNVVIRAYENKTKKCTVSLPPALADKLRVAAVGLGVDQGDLVAAGLELVLRGVEVRVRVVPTSEAQPAAGEGTEPPGLRVAG